jgi:hypothetical protein
MELVRSTLRKSDGSESQLSDYYRRSGITANLRSPNHLFRDNSRFGLFPAPLSSEIQLGSLASERAPMLAGNPLGCHRGAAGTVMEGRL